MQPQPPLKKAAPALNSDQPKNRLRLRSISKNGGSSSATLLLIVNTTIYIYILGIIAPGKLCRPEYPAVWERPAGGSAGGRPQGEGGRVLPTARHTQGQGQLPSGGVLRLCRQHQVYLSYFVCAGCGSAFIFCRSVSSCFPHCICRSRCFLMRIWTQLTKICTKLPIEVI